VAQLPVVAPSAGFVFNSSFFTLRVELFNSDRQTKLIDPAREAF
jgi:hypothetical protein